MAQGVPERVQAGFFRAVGESDRSGRRRCFSRGRDLTRPLCKGLRECSEVGRLSELGFVLRVERSAFILALQHKQCPCFQANEGGRVRDFAGRNGFQYPQAFCEFLGVEVQLSEHQFQFAIGLVCLGQILEVGLRQILALNRRQLPRQLRAGLEGNAVGVLVRVAQACVGVGSPPLHPFQY